MMGCLAVCRMEWGEVEGGDEVESKGQGQS